uniref:adenylate cyclase n=1 Tax=Trypanosoma vivax (strain Y486) TaxID=1055687 RepID=G0TW71_TRYVY|nr:conserved hypothetical protein [Trypanosoma vivax Y486]
MPCEAPSNEWETPAGADTTRPTGVYVGGRVPGTYLRTVTGVQRGEELFSRPDLERPWRTTTAQRHAMTVAMKEKEIEELMRKCSSLRTQLGNARHDAKYTEYAMMEKTNARVAELQDEIQRLKKSLKDEEDRRCDLERAMESQLRLQRAQHENELLHLKNESRMHQEHIAELTRVYQQQVDDVKRASEQELEHVEKICNVRVEELSSELKAAYASSKTAEERHAEELVKMKNLINRIEIDYKERSSAVEGRVHDMHTRLESEKNRFIEERDEALKESKTATERLAVALADSCDMHRCFKQWDTYLFSQLDRIYAKVLEKAPEKVIEPQALEVQETVSLYGPRGLIEDPEAKVTMERIVCHLLQMRNIEFDQDGPSSTEGGSEVVLDELGLRQERLTRAFREVEAKCLEAIHFMNRLLPRLYFFSDNLESAIEYSGSVAPPQSNVIFVCLRIWNGNCLWTEDADTMQAAAALMSCTLRPKMAQYGAYECYSDGVSLLLAFDDPIASCRFCVESQHWLMKAPWPQALLRSPWCSEVRCEGTNEVLFRGLRLAMAIHTGETFVEPTGIPCGDSYRCHYYGRAVCQVIYTCSVAHGGQILVSKPVWDMCATRKQELVGVVASGLGTISAAYFNRDTNIYEKEPLDIFQIFHVTLKNRTFPDTIQEDATQVSSLTDLRQSIVTTEIKGVEARCISMKEAIAALKDELTGVDTSIHSLMLKTQKAKTYFHLLPPSEVVVQMSKLYTVMEKIAARASSLRENIDDMEQKQEDLTGQTKGLRDYCSQLAQTVSRQRDQQIRAEVIEGRYKEQMREMARSHAEAIERLQSELRDRDWTIQEMCKRI